MTALARTNNSRRLYHLILSALGTALIAVSAMITVPFGPIPFTMQTCVVLIVALSFPPLCAWVAPALYIGMGAIGLPVFAGFKGGLGILIGPTAGFIWGFLLAGLAIALIRHKTASPRRDHLTLINQALLMLLIIYISGTIFYMHIAGVGLTAALALCVAPFLIPEAFKLIAAVLISLTIRRFLH